MAKRTDNILEVERMVMRVLLNDAEAVVVVADVLPNPNLFSDPLHAAVYRAMQALVRRGLPPVLASVAEQLGKALAEIQALATGYNTKDAREVVYLAEFVAQEGQRRLLQDALREALAMAEQPTTDVAGMGQVALNMIAGATADLTPTDESSVSDALAEVDETMKTALTREGMLGYHTGSRWLDDKTLGLIPRDLWVISGPYGGRKCVTGDTWLYTRRGWQQIGDVLADAPMGFSEFETEVWGRGRWRKTTHAYRSPVGKIVKLTTYCGYQLEGTPEHPVLIGENGAVTWRKLSRLKVGALVAIERQLPDMREGMPPTVAQAYRTAERVHATAINEALFFDEIVAIEAGEAETFDLVIPDGHAFMSNGFVSHNTTLANNLAIAALRDGARLSYFAAEGSRSDTASSMWAMLATEKLLKWREGEEAYLSGRFLLTGLRTEQQQRAMFEARKELDSWGSRLHIYDGRHGIHRSARITAQARRDRMLVGTDVIIVDYLQLLDDGKIFERLERISREMQTLCAQLGVCGIMLAQLNEGAIYELGTDNKNGYYSSGVKGGGDPAQAADVLLRVYPKMDNPNACVVEMKKARHALSHDKVTYHLNPQSGWITGESAQ